MLLLMPTVGIVAFLVGLVAYLGRGHVTELVCPSCKRGMGKL